MLRNIFVLFHKNIVEIYRAMLEWADRKKRVN